jgi:hypothetical protein
MPSLNMKSELFEILDSVTSKRFLKNKIFTLLVISSFIQWLRNVPKTKNVDPD